MRRRRSKALQFAVGVAILCTAGRRARAQTGVAVEGGLELLLPTGARGLGLAQAIVARGVGSEAIWINPAMIARGPREFAFNIAQQANGAIVADATGAIVWPVRRVGAFALSVRYFNEGNQPALNTAGEEVGAFTYTGTIAAGTFAAPFGSHIAAGLTLKFLQFNTQCTGGNCDLPSAQPRTAALDFGAQYFLTKDSLIAVGVSGLNLGLPLQVNDAPQSDLLPSRGVAGIAVAPKFAQLPKEVHMHAEADVIKRLSGGDAGYRFGTELGWLDQYAARVGYQLNGYSGSGPTFGLGFATGKLHVDFAQILTDAGAEGGKPTFLSLRYVF